MNTSTEQKIKIEKAAFIFNNPLTIGSTNNKVEWTFEGKDEDIVHIHPGCGSCTTNCKAEGNKITADYADHDSKKVKEADIERLYPDKRYPFSKSIRVYLKDDKPLHIIDENGNKKLNSEKSSVLLTFAGFVDISPLITNSK